MMKWPKCVAGLALFGALVACGDDTTGATSNAVDENVAPDPDDMSPAPEEEPEDVGPRATTDAATFDPDRLIQVAITMDPDDFDALRSQSRSFLSEFGGEDCRSAPFESPYTYFHAAIEIDGQSLPDIGIRKKGFIGSQSDTKPGFRINLDEYVDGAELFGVDNVTLNNGVQDPSLVRQCLAYQMFTAAGVAAPRCNFAQVSMNGEPLGVYVHIDPIKRTFLRTHFGNDDGDLYEGTVSDFLTQWTATFDPKTGDTDESLAPILAITRELASDTPTREVLERWFDLDTLMTYLAVENIIGHWDGYASNRNNFRVYRNPSTDKFVFIPWGTDGTFQSFRVEDGVYNKSVIAVAILDDPALAAMLEARVTELLDTIWDPRGLNEELDRLTALLTPELPNEREVMKFQAGVGDIRRYIGARERVLREALPGEPGEVEPAIGCMIEKGSIDATFETTWGPLDRDITREGELTLDLVWEGEQTSFVTAGVAAGFDEQGTALLVIVGLLNPEDESVFIPYLTFNPAAVAPGAPLPIGQRGGSSARGGLLFKNRDIGRPFEIGNLATGQLTFETFGTDFGDTVAGQYSGTYYGWEIVR